MRKSDFFHDIPTLIHVRLLSCKRLISQNSQQVNNRNAFYDKHHIKLCAGIQYNGSDLSLRRLSQNNYLEMIYNERHHVL